MKTIFTIIGLLLIGSVNAQWTDDTDTNTLVATTPAGAMQARSTSDGLTYIVFWKVVPAPTNYELRMQVLDVDGNTTLGDEGVLISDQIPMGTFTVTFSMEVASDDSVVLGVTGTGSGNPAFVFRLDSDGNHVWNQDGVSIGNGFSVTILPLSTGDTLVSWLSSSSGGVLQRLNADGASVWATPEPIELSGSTTAPANLFELTDGEYMVVFHELLSGVNSNLYAQRYDTDGNPQFATPTQLSDKITAFNRLYSVVQDGDVIYMGYFAPTGSRFDSYLQRVDADGTIPWGINGSDFSLNVTDNEGPTEIAFEEGANSIWAVCNYANSGQSENGEYVQKYDKNTGDRLLTDNAKELYPIGSEKIHAGSLRLNSGMPFFLIKDGIDNGATPVSLNVTLLDENGDFEWIEETRPVATFAANKSRIHFTQTVNDQSVAVFVEDKGEGEKIYAQNVTEEILAVDEFSQSSFFYSNPVKNELNIQNINGLESIAIYTMLGQQIFTSNYNSVQQVSVATQSWKAGVYLLTVKTSKGTATSVKLIKE